MSALSLVYSESITLQVAYKLAKGLVKVLIL